MTYKKEYDEARNNTASFWLKQSAKLNWHTQPKLAISDDREWFPDGKLNTCYLALDQHVNAGFGEQTALIYDSPVTNKKSSFTYNELLNQVSRFAYVLKQYKVCQGDTVVIYMPMIPQAAVAMLACARIGAVHSVVFGGFAAKELATRIDDAKPKLIITASAGIEVEKVIEYKPLVDQALTLAKHRVDHCIVYQREIAQAAMNFPFDKDWENEMAKAKTVDAISLKATRPLYILYTSGTTGKPKGIVRDHGGHAVAMSYSMKAVYNAKPGSVFWAASDVGWVVGHSYIVYGPLISRCTTILYEGKPVRTPDASAFWRVCEEYKVNILFAAPTAFRAIRKEDPIGHGFNQFELGHLKGIYLAGERLDPSTYNWLQQKAQKPIIDHWWQTETGWAIAATPMGIDTLPTKSGAAGVPMPGFDVRILDDEGTQVVAETKGNIAIKLPLPPGCLKTLWQDDQRYQDSYLSSYQGYYVTGDGGLIDKEGYLTVLGRTDDVINVAGHRLSTGEMEQTIAEHGAVAECAVVGIPCPIKGQVPLALVVCQNGVELDHQLESRLNTTVRENIGAIASLKRVLLVEKLPKTRSGKILRKLIRQMIEKEQFSIPSTIEDASVVADLKLVLAHQL